MSFPPTAPFPQPILIVAHGAGDTPDALCRAFRDIVGDRGALLCPAGPRLAFNTEGRYFPDHLALERIVFASLEALATTYPGAVDRAGVVYGGYSQGATMGALMIPEHGRECPRLLLVEGGVDDWTVARATTFHAGGGRRVLFACGREQCRSHAEHAAGWLRAGGVEARVVARVGAGHTYGRAVAAAVRGAFEWLVEGDARWAPPTGVVGSGEARAPARQVPLHEP